MKNCWCLIIFTFVQVKEPKTDRIFLITILNVLLFLSTLNLNSFLINEVICIMLNLKMHSVVVSKTLGRPRGETRSNLRKQVATFILRGNKVTKD